MCRGSSRESGPTSFQTRLFIIKKQLASLSCVTREAGEQAGEWQELDAVEAAWPGEVPLQSDAGVTGLGCSGALASKTSGVTALTLGFTF